MCTRRRNGLKRRWCVSPLLIDFYLRVPGYWEKDDHDTVGPDRESKADNHCNAAFAHEGNEFRRWVQQYNESHGNLILVCGDRHWQYHSVDPATGVEEFSSGCASDYNAAGSPGYNPTYHRFHRVKGGFLSVSVSKADDDAVIAFRFYDVHGKLVYEHTKRSELPRN